MFDPHKKIDKDRKCLKDKCDCTPIIVGPTGPTGPSGSSDTISIGRTITGEAGGKAAVIDNKILGNHKLDFIIPMGPTGPVGPSLCRSAYVVTFNNDTAIDGVAVLSGERLPLERVELDTTDLINVNQDDNTIKFNAIGYYRISFKISAYPKVLSPDFDPTHDIVSVGFREVNTDNVYVGVGQWVFNGEAVELTAEGIVAIYDPSVTYELVNLSKEVIYLNTPSIKNIASTSYFSNPLITLVVEYLGR